MDVFNTMRQRPASNTFKSEQRKLMSEEHEQREKALQKRARNFVDGIIQYISSEKEYYKFIIRACKENTNMIMELGFITCYNRDDILNGLQRIDDDIAKGSFEWRENKDVRSNIIESLVERVGEPARKLDATISLYVQKQTILRLWFHDSVDKIITQIEQLQVELVLLALRNWGFVLPLLFGRTDWIILGELIMSKVELLDRDVSRLRTCKNKIDSTLLITFPLGSADGCLDRFPNDDSRLLQNAVINFGNMIVGDISIHISTLQREISYWIGFRFLTHNDEVNESFSLLKKHVSDLGKLTMIQRDSFTCYDSQDPCQRFLAVFGIVQQILRSAKDFAKSMSFSQENVQSFPSFVKVKDKDRSEKEKKDEDGGATVTQEFRSCSDEVMKRLIDWLDKHQTGETPLKFCQFRFE